MKPTLLVLAAGMGSRYGGLKQMDGVGPSGETIIDYSIHDAVKAGFGKVVYIVREYFKADMEKAVKEKYAHVKTIDGEPLEFVFVTQELNKIPERFLPLNPDRQKPWGTAHAVLMARDVIHEPFAVINGDDFYGAESFRILGDWCRKHENTSGQYCIVGFELENTLSENGSVSRGICTYDENFRLTGIAEHVEISKNDKGIVEGDNTVNGQHVTLDAKALCSMNMWGFTPDYFALSGKIFEGFLEENSMQLKKEFYIPFAVDRIVASGNGACDVLATPSRWFGVTYQADRPGVVAKFKELAEKGVYPSPLYA
ncbi:MAG: nucleotidyltransferase [Bacteroidales bacterium]|nr:nucleotidyltransferase [Bacteroidales bacterium]